MRLRSDCDSLCRITCTTLYSEDTGDEFCARIAPDGFDFFTPTGYDKILREGTKILENLLDIQVPMIAAINGPVTVHSEYALLCDIVIATEHVLLSGCVSSRIRHRAR